MLRRLMVALAVAILAQASLAQVPAQPVNDPDDNKKPPGHCSVTGRVVSAVDGTPLRSARVALILAGVHRPSAV
jgi:hypothetical protein